MPLFKLLQVTFVPVAVTVNPGGWFTVVLVEAVQPLLSVTVIVYVPAGRLLAVWPVCPLLQEKVYGVVPPEGEDVTKPLLWPAQLGVPTAEILTVNAVGCVMVNTVVAWQVFWSVASMV